MRIFDCKNQACQEIYISAPKITDHLCSDCSSHYKKTKDFLHHLNIDYRENKQLVRGLDYYTQTVFEFKMKGLGAQDTIIAGGRYDLLMTELGGTDTPCIGWAMGVERMLLALGENQPEIEKHKSFFIAVMGEDLFGEIVSLRGVILERGGVCIVGNPLDKIKAQLKDAKHYQVDYVIIYGTNEAEKHVYTIKNMQTGEQKEVSKSEIMDFFKNC